MRGGAVVPLLISALALGLAGCSAGPPEPPPEPDLTRGKVLWADTMCSQTKELDSLKSRPGSSGFDPATDSDSYLYSASSSVESLREAFAGVPRLSNEEANRLVQAYVQELTRIEPEVQQLGASPPLTCRPTSSSNG